MPKKPNDGTKPSHKGDASVVTDNDANSASESAQVVVDAAFRKTVADALRDAQFPVPTTETPPRPGDITARMYGRRVRRILFSVAIEVGLDPAMVLDHYQPLAAAEDFLVSQVAIKLMKALPDHILEIDPSLDVTAYQPGTTLEEVVGKVQAAQDKHAGGAMMLVNTWHGFAYPGACSIEQFAEHVHHLTEMGTRVGFCMPTKEIATKVIHAVKEAHETRDELQFLFGWHGRETTPDVNKLLAELIENKQLLVRKTATAPQSVLFNTKPEDQPRKTGRPRGQENKLAAPPTQNASKRRTGCTKRGVGGIPCAAAPGGCPCVAYYENLGEECRHCAAHCTYGKISSFAKKGGDNAKPTQYAGSTTVPLVFDTAAQVSVVNDAGRHVLENLRATDTVLEGATGSDVARLHGEIPGTGGVTAFVLPAIPMNVISENQLRARGWEVTRTADDPAYVARHQKHGVLRFERNDKGFHSWNTPVPTQTALALSVMARGTDDESPEGAERRERAFEKHLASGHGLGFATMWAQMRAGLHPHMEPLEKADIPILLRRCITCPIANIEKPPTRSSTNRQVAPLGTYIHGDLIAFGGYHWWFWTEDTVGFNGVVPLASKQTEHVLAGVITAVRELKGYGYTVTNVRTDAEATLRALQEPLQTHGIYLFMSRPGGHEVHAESHIRRFEDRMAAMLRNFCELHDTEAPEALLPIIARCAVSAGNATVTARSSAFAKKLGTHPLASPLEIITRRALDGSLDKFHCGMIVATRRVTTAPRMGNFNPRGDISLVLGTMFETRRVRVVNLATRQFMERAPEGAIVLPLDRFSAADRVRIKTTIELLSRPSRLAQDDSLTVQLPSETEGPTLPETGVPILPETEGPTLPETGVPILPETGVPILPETGVPILPETGVPIPLEAGVPIPLEAGVPIHPPTAATPFLRPNPTNRPKRSATMHLVDYGAVEEHEAAIDNDQGARVPRSRVLLVADKPDDDVDRMPSLEADSVASDDAGDPDPFANSHADDTWSFDPFIDPETFHHPTYMSVLAIIKRKEARGMSDYGRAVRAELQKFKTLEAIAPRAKSELTPEERANPFYRSHWVYTTTDDPEKPLKARLVILGNADAPDPAHTSSPTVARLTLNLTIAVSALQKWEVVTFDIASAFLHAQARSASTTRKVVLLTPDIADIMYELTGNQGFRTKRRHDGSVLVTAEKALYGFRESPQDFYVHMRDVLKGAGWSTSAFDPCMFFLPGLAGDAHARAILLVHVDDILLAAPRSSSTVEDFQKVLDANFTAYTFNSGPEIMYLGTLIKQRDGVFSLSQEHFAKTAVAHLPEDALPAHTPMTEEYPKLEDRGDPVSKDQQTWFISSVATLMWLATTVIELKFALSHLARHQGDVRTADLEALGRMHRYVRAHPSRELVFRPGGSLALNVYTDASFAPGPGSRSHSGVVIHLQGTGLLACDSRLQSRIAQSTQDAETIAQSHGVNVALFLQSHLRELAGVDALHRIKVLQDNRATINLSETGYHALSSVFKRKHPGLNYNWLAEQFSRGETSHAWCPSKLMIADALTKPLPRRETEEMFNAICDPGRHLSQTVVDIIGDAEPRGCVPGSLIEADPVLGMRPLNQDPAEPTSPPTRRMAHRR